jgi:hypothetical protein
VITPRCCVRPSRVIARLCHPLRHSGLGLRSPGARVVRALVTKPRLGGQHPVAVGDHVPRGPAGERVLRLRVEIDLHDTVVDCRSQLLRRRPARSVEDILEPRPRVSPLERPLAVREDLGAQLYVPGSVDAVHVPKGRRQQVAPACAGPQRAGNPEKVIRRRVEPVRCDALDADAVLLAPNYTAFDFEQDVELAALL